RGVIVKDGNDIIGLGDRYLRVDVNLKKHMDRFLAALDQVKVLHQACAKEERMADHALVLGIDVGGTFTDAIAFDPDRGNILAAFKVPSTPGDPAAAVIAALERIAEQHGVHGATVCHGTTVGTNTLIERKGAKVGLVTTEGFTDVIELRRQNRPTLYHFSVEISEPLVPPERRYGAKERIGPSGEVIQDLSEIDKLIDAIKETGSDSLAP